jgi:hypothetical protein
LIIINWIPDITPPPTFSTNRRPERTFAIRRCSHGHEWHYPCDGSFRSEDKADAFSINGENYCIRCIEEFMSANIGRVIYEPPPASE